MPKDSKDEYGCKSVENVHHKNGNLLGKLKITTWYMKLQCILKQVRRYTYNVTSRRVRIFASLSLPRRSYYFMRGSHHRRASRGVPGCTLMHKTKWLCVLI